MTELMHLSLACGLVCCMLCMHPHSLSLSFDRAQLSPYEQKRDENITRNNQILQNLGIVHMAAQMQLDVGACECCVSRTLPTCACMRACQNAVALCPHL